jgi:MFS family permease
MWVFGRHRSVRAIGIVSIAAFPAGLALLVLLPPTFGTLAGFAVICGAANGVITIVRGLVVPEMLTRDAYGAINGVLAVPANIAKALAPAATAALWALSRSYDTVLMAALVSCAFVVAAFAFAALRHDRTADAA